MAGSGFLSIPIAVSYLSKEQLGLWAVVNSVLSYLVWMDLGLGDATGRKVAKAVAENDQVELNRWWTLSRCIMGLMGLVVILLGFGIAPLTLRLFDVSPGLESDAYWLILGAVALVGISIPIRGISGLLTAQKRFYLSPLGQAVTVWVNVGVFYLMLRMGHGLLSYFWASLAASVCLWSYYSYLVYAGPQRPRVDFSGCSRSRVKDLLGFGLNVAGTGFMEALNNNLPALLLGRLGGLAAVPVFTITARGPLLLVSLVRKTVWAFYPSFLRLQVTGRSEELLRYHRVVGQFTLGVALVACGGVLAWNETLVLLLADRTFFAGSTVNSILAAVVIIDPLSRLFQCLMHLSGSMRKAALVSAACVAVISVTAVMLYRIIGLPGLAVSIMLLPIVMGSYGYLSGGRRCCFERKELSLESVKLGALSILAIGCAWFMLDHFPTGSRAYEWAGRSWLLPSAGSLATFVVFCVTGCTLAVHAFRGISSNRAGPPGRIDATPSIET